MICDGTDKDSMTSIAVAYINGQWIRDHRSSLLSFVNTGLDSEKKEAICFFSEETAAAAPSPFHLGVFLLPNYSFLSGKLRNE